MSIGRADSPENFRLERITSGADEGEALEPLDTTGYRGYGRDFGPDVPILATTSEIDFRSIEETVDVIVHPLVTPAPRPDDGLVT